MGAGICYIGLPFEWWLLVKPLLLQEALCHHYTYRLGGGVRLWCYGVTPKNHLLTGQAPTLKCPSRKPNNKLDLLKKTTKSHENENQMKKIPLKPTQKVLFGQQNTPQKTRFINN